MLVATTVTLLLVVVALGLALAPSSPPNASFAFEYDDTRSELRVTFTGGDEIPSSRLTVRDGNGTEVGNWSGDTVSTGETAVVDGASPEGTYSVVWQSPDDERIRLASWPE